MLSLPRVLVSFSDPAAPRHEYIHCNFVQAYVLANMVDRLANVLHDLAQSDELQNAVDLLRRSANGVDSSSSEKSRRSIEQQEPTYASSSSHANPRPRGPG